MVLEGMNYMVQTVDEMIVQTKKRTAYPQVAYRQQRDSMIRLKQEGNNVQVQIEYPFVSEIFVERKSYIQSSEVQASQEGVKPLPAIQGLIEI